MARVGWTRTELSGRTLVVLVDLTFAGRVYRVATMPVQVGTATDVLHYDATVDDLVWSRSLDLFSLQPEPESIVVSCIIPANVAALVAAGHSLEGSSVQVSQVRVEKGADGAAVDAWESRRVCISGRVVDSEYGAANDDGKTYVRFAAERNAFESTTQIPTDKQRVTDETWKTSGHIAGSDVDVYYPIPIGYPGRDDSSASGWITGSIGAWVDKRSGFQLLALAIGKVEATTVELNTDNDTAGVTVNVRYTYTRDNLVGYESRDKLGTLIAVVHYRVDGYDTSLATTYRPAVDSSEQIFVGWPAGSGGILWRGKVLRDAGDVAEWAMEQAGIPVDFGRFQSARAMLAWLKVDTVIDEGCNPVEWLTSAVLPLLPVSLVMNENGVAPWVWNSRSTRADAVCHLDCDTDPTLDPADTVKCDASDIANTFELGYSYSQRAEQYTHTARLGPKRIPTTSAAKSYLLGNSTDKRIDLYARTVGAAGTGIVVVYTVTAAILSVVDSAGTVTINSRDGVTTPQQLTDRINTDSALIEATNASTSGGVITGTSTPRVTLRLPDYGTTGSSICARSKQILESADPPGPNAGIRRRAEETRILYDHGSAAGVLEWWAAAYGLPHRRIEVMAPEEHYGWLDLGDTITFTRAALGFDETVGIIEAIDMYSDGMVGFRILFIDASPAG